jgi:hypothetical protein
MAYANLDRQNVDVNTTSMNIPVQPDRFLRTRLVHETTLRDRRVSASHGIVSVVLAEVEGDATTTRRPREWCYGHHSMKYV